MTKEEAKIFIYSIAGDLGFTGVEKYTCKDGEKMREAVQALEQEPCGDSKPETVTEFADRCRECGAKYGKLLKTGHWIPVSERPPEDGTWNLFTDGKTVSVERYKADALDHFYPEGRWFSFDEAIGWMPLPEPYKKKEDKE